MIKFFRRKWRGLKKYLSEKFWIRLFLISRNMSSWKELPNPPLENAILIYFQKLDKLIWRNNSYLKTSLMLFLRSSLLEILNSVDEGGTERSKNIKKSRKKGKILVLLDIRSEKNWLKSENVIKGNSLRIRRWIWYKLITNIRWAKWTLQRISRDYSNQFFSKFTLKFIWYPHHWICQY